MVEVVKAKEAEATVAAVMGTVEAAQMVGRTA